MRPIDTMDVEDVTALPRLRCLRCPARVAVRAQVRNLTPKARELALTLRVRGPGLDERDRAEAAEARGGTPATRSAGA